MKGLLIKDVKIMMIQKGFFVMLLLISIVLMVSNQNISMVISYMGCVSAMVVSNTIAYDEAENGIGYLLTLPIRRRDYVSEKYVLGVLTIIAVTAGCGVIIAGFALANIVEFDSREWMLSLMFMILIVSFMISIMIPVYIKYGSQKSRLAVLLTVGVLGGCIYGSSRIMEMLHMDVDGIILSILQMPPVIWLGIGCLLGGAMQAVSCMISMRIMKAKQY